MHINVEIVKTLSVERLCGPEAWVNLTAEWESLDEQVFPRSPFTSPLWIELWWRHIQRRNPLFRDEFFCHIVRDADGRLVAIAPLILLGRAGHFRAGDPMPVLPEAASRDIRAAIGRGEDVSEIVPRAVLEYAGDHGLYPRTP